MYEVGVGDSPMRIAKKLGGNPYRYGELLAANPHKSIAYVNGVPTFTSIGIGESLVVPLGFVGATAPVSATGGWHTPTRDLIKEFTQDQKRAPTTDEVNILRRLSFRNNDVLARMRGGHKPDRTDEMDFNTAQGLINFYLVNGRGPDGKDPVAPPRGGPEIESLITTAVHAVPGKKSVFSKITDAIEVITTPITAVIDVVEKVPVIGDVVHIVNEAATAPLRVANSIASGARLDHVLVGALKDQLKIVKDVAPYAQTVVSLVPGLGSGVAMAIGAGAALAEGQSITEAGKAAIRGAIPGGPLAAAAFDTALKVASGENVAQSALEGARGLIPAGPAQKAFDIGLAIATGEKIQTALANGLASLAPAQLQTIISAGKQALAATPSLASAVKSVAPGAATQGFEIAAGLLATTGISEKALVAARNQLPADVRQGFDTALKTQEPHIAWLKNVTSASVPFTTAPKVLAPPIKVAATAPPAVLAPPKKTTAPVVLTPPKKTTSAPKPAAVPSKYAPYPKNIAAVAGVGSGALDSLWSDAKWRWFLVHGNGVPIAQRGPVWLSENDAQREAAAFLESTQGRNYVGAVKRWDWDPNTYQWHQASTGALGESRQMEWTGGGSAPVVA